jgi:CheY-like chemotaxis protein
LVGYGLQVTIADSGSAALQLLAKQRFDLVFMDLQMPDMDGLETTRRIRSGALGRPQADVAVSDRQLPIIAMTAHAMASDRAACFAAGMDDFVSKPLTTAAMERVLRQWLPCAGDDCRSVSGSVGRQSARAEHGAFIEFDEQRLLSLLGWNQETFRTVLRMFLENSEESLNALEKSLQSGDMDAGYETAHSLKGATAYIYCAPLESQLVKLMEACREKNKEEALSLLTTTRQNHQQLKAAIEAALAE